MVTHHMIPQTRNMLVQMCAIILFVYFGRAGNVNAVVSSNPGEVYREELRMLSTETLEQRLYERTRETNIPIGWFESRLVLVNELCQRLGQEAAPILDRYIQHLSEQPTIGSFEERGLGQLRALVVIKRRFLRANGDEERYIQELEDVLFVHPIDKYVSVHAMVALGNIGTPRVRDLLKQHEYNEYGYDPSVKTTRLNLDLKLDWQERSKDEQIGYILASAREAIAAANGEQVNLVAEGEVLRGRFENIAPRLLEEMQTSTWMRQERPALYTQYMDFLKETHAFLKHHEIRSSVGEQQAYHLYQQSLAEPVEVYLQHLDRWNEVAHQNPTPTPDVSPPTPTPIPAMPTTPTPKADPFSPLSDAELIATLAQTPTFRAQASASDRATLRRVAQLIGDRALAGTLTLSEADKSVIAASVQDAVQSASAYETTAEDYEDAMLRVQGLWRLAAPALLPYLDSEDMAQVEFAAKALITMRDEAIVQAIIAQAKQAATPERKDLYLFLLSKMQERRVPVISGRPRIDTASSEDLYRRLVAPALRELQTGQ